MGLGKYKGGYKRFYDRDTRQDAALAEPELADGGSFEHVVLARRPFTIEETTMAEQLRDVVVVLPGIMGSVLRDAHGDDVWKLSAGSILKDLLGRGKAIKRLQLPDGIGDDHPGDSVTATALMPDMHVVPGIWTVTVGYERLLASFRESFDVVEADPARPGSCRQLRAVPVRLAPVEPVQRAVLQQTVEPVLERFRSRPGNADARLVFISHSMGGLVTSYYVDVLGGHEVPARSSHSARRPRCAERDSSRS